MRFVLLVEGQTEREVVGPFVKRWLSAKLAPKQIGISAIEFGGSGHFIKEFAAEAAGALAKASATRTIGVIGLLDHYGCPAASRDARRLEEKVADPRFRMFFAMHETEAWLLSEPEILPQSVQASLPREAVAHPENVNDTDPPSKLLNQLYRHHCNRKYRKTTDGPRLFRKLDPKVARDKCPKLREMLDVMLEMAKAAGL